MSLNIRKQSIPAKEVITVDLEVDSEMDKWMASFGVNADDSKIKDEVASAKLNLVKRQEHEEVTAANRKALARAKKEWKKEGYVAPGKEKMVIKFNFKAKPKKRKARDVRGTKAPEKPDRRHEDWTIAQDWADAKEEKEEKAPALPARSTKKAKPPPLPSTKLAKAKPPPFPSTKLNKSKPPPFPSCATCGNVRKPNRPCQICAGKLLHEKHRHHLSVLLNGGVQAGDFGGTGTLQATVSSDSATLPFEHAAYGEGRHADADATRAGMQVQGGLSPAMGLDGLLHGHIEQGDLGADGSHAAIATADADNLLAQQHSIDGTLQEADSDEAKVNRAGMQVQGGFSPAMGLDGLLHGHIEQGDLGADGSHAAIATADADNLLAQQHSVECKLADSEADIDPNRRVAGLRVGALTGASSDFVDFIIGGIEHGDLGMDEYWCGNQSVAKTANTRHLNGVFDDVIALPYADQAQFFLDAFWDELGDHAEAIYSILYHFNRLVDMKDQDIESFQYQEGTEMDLNLALLMFDCVEQHFQSDGKVEATRFPLAVPQAVQAITRKTSLVESLDPMFNGKVKFLEVLLFQFQKTPEELQAKAAAAQADQERMSTAALDALNADLDAARTSLEDVQRRIKKFEREKARLRKLAQGSGVKALRAKNMLAQLESSPCGEQLRRALITAQAAVRKLTKLAKKTSKTSNAHMDGSVWWLNRDLEEKQTHFSHE